MATYSTFLTDLSTYAEIATNDSNLIAVLPTIIAQAELQCYRDLDLLTAYAVDTSGTTTPNSRNFTLPTAVGRFIVVEQFMTVTGGVRAPCAPASVATINTLWPSNTAASSASTPTLFSRLNDTTLLLGPSPGSALATEVRGTVRPTPLSASNTTSWLSLYAYDLFFAAAMASMTAYMREWNMQPDGTNWDTRYAKLLPMAQVEELRKKLLVGTL
jgi:hypothetical protein